MARSPEERSATGAGSGVLAVRLHDDGLKVEEIETPSPDRGEVLVRVHAAAITRDELEWPVDRLPAIPSYELSGVVVGSGDEVYALTPFDRDGVAAEYAVVPADVLAPKPLRLSHVEAAALPMGGLTAWQALFVHGRLARGEWVLVTGASGGVGHIAVQLARHAGAAVVESGPIDLVFDTRGGEVPPGERVVTIAEEMPGAIYFIVEPGHQQLLELTALVDAGDLRAEVDSVFPLTESRPALERGAARGTAAHCGHRGSDAASAWRCVSDAGRPVGIVIVEDETRAVAADARRTRRACGRDDCCASRGRELHGESAGHSAGAVHEDPLACRDRCGLLERLVGGERGHREGRGRLPRDDRRLARNKCGRG